MKRDSLFFELFRDLPRGFFDAIGRSDVDPRQYELRSIESKESAVRLDEVFLPRTRAAGPAYIWEAQCYRASTVYANLLSKIGRFLEHGDPSQEWVAVVIYPTRSLEQKNLSPYRCLLNSDQMVRVYLDELPASETDHLELGILNLIAVGPDEALRKARQLVPRVRSSRLSAEFRRLVIQFIETVIVHQFPKMSREEVERMLQVTDVRETRVFQEALEEGLEKGLEKGREEGREEATVSLATQLLRRGDSVAAVAELTGLSVAKVRALKKRLNG
jgi:predicted transposase/invertase (TIGR01784 family)